MLNNRKVLAVLMAVIMTAGAVLPVSASSSLYGFEEGVAAATTENDTVSVAVKRLAGACDGDGFVLATEDDFGEGTELSVSRMRALEEIQKDMDAGLAPADRYGLEDIEALLTGYILPEDGMHIVIDEAYDIRLLDVVGYDLTEVPKTNVQITFRENLVTDADTKTRLQTVAGDKLYHYKEDGTWEELLFTADEDLNEVRFETEGFSPFVFAHFEERPIDDPENNAEPEDIEEEIINEEVIEDTQEDEPEESAVTVSDDGITDSEDTAEPIEIVPEKEGAAEENVTDNSSPVPEEPIAEPISNDTDKAAKDNDGNTASPIDEFTIPKGLTEVREDRDSELLQDSNLSAVTRKMLSGALRGITVSQEPVTEDGMTIEKITMKWLSSSTGSTVPAGYDRLEITPEADDVAAQQWQIDFALSGKHEHNAGDIEVVIPANIWFDRDGNEAGVVTLAVPEDPDAGAEWNWKRVGDNIVFTNTRNLSAATKVMIQGSYRQMVAHMMVDKDVSEESGHYDAEFPGISRELQATVNVVVPNGNTISMTSNSIDASINTAVSAASATKTAYNSSSRSYYLYWNVPNNIPSEFLPESPQDYVYVRWYVSGQAQGNQPYVMTVTDDSSGEYGCRVLGVQGASGNMNIKSEDGSTVTAELFTGYNTQTKSAYVWTAYEKAYFDTPMQLYTVHNTQTITVKGVDDLIETQRQASAEVSLAMPLSYTVTKEWDDNDNALGLRPNSQSVSIYTNDTGGRHIWKTVSLNAGNNWSYTWSDGGLAQHFETSENSFASGSFRAYYDENGGYHTQSWRYAQKSKTYDPDTRTWHFVNDLRIGQEATEADIKSMDKQVASQFDDPYQRSTRDRALNELLHGNDAVIPYTVKGRVSDTQAWKDNAESIDTHRVNVILEDNQKTNGSASIKDPVLINNKRVTSVTDYELAYADITMPKIYTFEKMVKDSALPEGDPDRYYNDRFTLKRGSDALTDATFEGFINGEWVTLAVLQDGTMTGRNGARVSNTRINFPTGVTRFREIVRTYGAVTELSYVIGVRIHPSEFVLNEIANAAALSDYMMMAVDNHARLYELDEGLNGENVSETAPLGTDEGWMLADWDRGYLHGRVYRVAAWQDKTFELTANDASKKRLKIHTTATTTQQSNVLNRSDYDKAVRDGDIPYTESGTWYDLLPLGMEPDTTSVRLQNGDRLTDVYTIQNYKNTGRTMLVIKADLAGHVSYKSSSAANPFPLDTNYPKEGYKQTQVVEFDAYYSWEDARSYGLDGVRNTIAFQTDDEWIGNVAGWEGEPDDPLGGKNNLTEAAVGNDAEVMTDIGLTDTPSYVYGGANLIYENPDFAAETSIRKWVTAEGTGVWSYGHNNEAVVYEGGRYTYRVNVTSDAETLTKNIIILDSLENYVPTSDKLDDYGDHQWRGRFQSIDVSGLRSIGIEPVVYYSTVPNLAISKEEGGYNTSDEQGVIADILENATTGTGEKVWSTSLPDDPETVTAYAVDCRHKADGTDFVLDGNKGETMSFYVYMRAPQEEAAEDIWCAGSGAKADPDPADRDETDPDDNAHAYNNVYLDATQVDGVGRETHSYYHWDYVKVGIVPFNIHVTKHWDDMDNNDGIRPESATIHLLANGQDTGRELVLDGTNEWSGEFEHVLRYDDDGEWITYTFTEDTADGYAMTYTRSGEDVNVFNTHEPEKIDIPFEKIWEGDTEDVRPAAVVVRLYADGVFTGTKHTVRANTDGTWTGVFTDLYKYKDGHEIEYTLQEEIVDDYRISYNGATITNTYHPYGDLTVSKTLVNATQAAADVDFTFTVILQDADGNDLIEEYAYETSDGRTGTIMNGGTVNIKGGQTFTVKDIPSHTRYKVVEDSMSGFTLIEKSGDTGEIVSYETRQASFTNRYASKGSASLKAQKILNGRNPERYQFRFMVEEEISGTYTLLRMASNLADGSVSFGDIRYTDADDGITHTYRISESASDKAGYTYDTHAVYAKVTPHDNGDGTMSCETVYYDEDGNEIPQTDIIEMSDGFVVRSSAWNAMTEEEQTALKTAHANEETGDDTVTEAQALPTAFINQYTASGSIVLRAWKQLTGRTLEDGEFEFELLDGKSNVIQTVTNTEDGSIIFNALPFTEKNVGKTYYFFVREKAGEDETVIYDTNVYGFDVTVVDNGDGTLSFRQGHITVRNTAAEGEDPVYEKDAEKDDINLFQNRLKDGSLSVSKKTKWQEGDDPDEDTEFHFKVRLIKPDGTPFEDGSIEYDIEQIENIGASQTDSGPAEQGGTESEGTQGQEGGS